MQATKERKQYEKLIYIYIPSYACARFAYTSQVHIPALMKHNKTKKFATKKTVTSKKELTL